MSSTPSSTPLAAGTAAPDFTLHAGPDRTVSLAELRGRPVILAFYPADWSPVCGDQIALYNEVLEAFDAYGAQLLGLSVDGVWCHKAFGEARHLHFPLLADFHPQGAVSRAYGAFREADGFSERALFVLDADGVVRWSYLSPVTENPGADGILAALDALTPGQRGAGRPAPAPAAARPAGGEAPNTQAPNSHVSNTQAPNTRPPDRQRAAERPGAPADALAANTNPSTQDQESRP